MVKSMKKKTLEEMKNLSVIELQAKLREEEEKSFRMNFKHATTPLKNPLELRGIRRNIARLKTLLNQKGT